MDLPATLRPCDEIDVALPSGGAVRLPVCRPVFTLWSGAPVFTFGGKPVLDHEGEPCFAELAILRTLLAHGWSGAWVEAFRGRQRYRFLQSMPASWQFDSDFVMPEDKFSIFESIGGACLDVMAWRGRDMLFCEAKRRKRDGFKPPQLRFIEGALARGIPREAILVAEWTTARPGRA